MANILYRYHHLIGWKTHISCLPGTSSRLRAQYMHLFQRGHQFAWVKASQRTDDRDIDIDRSLHRFHIASMQQAPLFSIFLRSRS